MSARRYLDILRSTKPSPEVLAVIEHLEAEEDLLAKAWAEGYCAAMMDCGPFQYSETANPYEVRS